MSGCQGHMEQYGRGAETSISVLADIEHEHAVTGDMPFAFSTSNEHGAIRAAAVACGQL